MDRARGPRVPEQRVPEEREVAAEDGRRLRFSVLGPVRAWSDGEPLPSGSPQQRALLAALLLREGRTATAAELIDALWGEEPPARALAAVRTYASRLRKVLGPGALVSEAGGYAARVPAGGLDFQVAQDLAAKAEKARTAGDRRGARALLEQSLGLWDGEPLAHLPGPFAETQRARLAEWRLGLVEMRLDLDLELGCHAEAVSELTGLTAMYPLRERLRELLMLALYRSGRQAEALAVFTDTRKMLAEELGVDPRPELTELQRSILNADEELARPAVEAVPGIAAPRPAQLPATVPDFTGRADFVQQLSDRLALAENAVVGVSALAGIGGVGKTTLAVHVAHAARPHFPDGQLYVDLQGSSDAATDPETVLGSFLRALGIPDRSMPKTLQERSALYRSTLDGRRVLVLLDNARDAAQVRPLLPGNPGCAALVTGRMRMVDLAGAHLVDLDVMLPEEALELFTKIVGPERVLAEPESALDVVAACGFLPLAIRIAASRLASRRTWTVSVLAAKLADERRRLDELQAGDLAVKATFELGYGQLEPPQARAFRLLGLADGPEISLQAAASVLNLSIEVTEALLETLVDTSLVESAAPGRYRFHDLVRLYARACAERDEVPPGKRLEALDRLLDFYLATASRVYGMERPGDRTVAHLEPTRAPGLSFGAHADALDWLYTEATSILACAQQSLDHRSLLRRAVDLLLAAKDLSESGANSRAYEAATLAARDAAEASGDARAEGRARTTLTQVYIKAGRFDEADDEAGRAMDLETATEDAWLGSNLTNVRSIIAFCQDRYADCERFSRAAVESFRVDGNRPGEASALCNTSRALVAMGRTAEAIELVRAGMAIYDALGLTLRLANARFALGIALFHAEHYSEATAEFQLAIQVFEENRQRLWLGTTYFRVAQVQLAADRPAQAARFAEQALATGFIGGDWMRANILTELGSALSMLAQPGRARACWLEALGLYEGLGADRAAEVRLLLRPMAA